MGFLLESTRHESKDQGVASPATSIATSTTGPIETASSTSSLLATTSTSATSVPSTTTTAPVTQTTIATTINTTTSVVQTTTTLFLPATTSPSAAHLVASYPKDDLGRLVIPVRGTASFALTNTGGLATQWLLSGTGFSAAGASQGQLNPRESVTVMVGPAKNTPETKVSGQITVLGPNPLTIAFIVAD